VTALLKRASYTVDPWEPGYGVALGDDLDGRESTARLDLDIELPAGRWRPVSPECSAALPSSVLFLDGVRRIDARVWVHGKQPQPIPGIATSLAAGLLCCDGTAHIIEVRVDRGLYTAAAEATDLDTRHATYTLRRTGAGLDDLPLAVQRRLSEVEVELAVAWRTRGPENDLLVVDGPLRGRTHLTRTVGYVKTHHAAYLPQPQAHTVTTLATGQRSPVFTMGTSWQRHSWYLRLPSASTAPWAAIVRLECSADLSPADAIALADLTTRLLPSLASTPHKDPRAPQNLVPIGGLERQLRHRLGDAALLYRSLRAAAA
jgi:hypothetical protein